MAADTVVKGPAIIEQADTTTLIPEGWQVRSAPGDNLLMTRMRG
jgi:N-methylhydantoinase A/oxoprolinase/acetone carboxylase beta subunit